LIISQDIIFITNRDAKCTGFGADKKEKDLPG
jgi:hypothetical protein